MAKKEKLTPEQAAEVNAEALETGNSLAGDVEATAKDVFVFANLPNAQSFKLGNGIVVTIEGMAVSNLKRPGGGFFSGGKYMVTAVNRDEWAEVERVYGKMRMFQNKLVFAADTFEEGKAIARELGGLRHGYEPVDPASSRVKSTPDTKE